MILSVSRRTDVPAFYSNWFFNRLYAGEVVVPNPVQPRQCSRLLLSPETVDCIVFWSKNPAPMLPRLGELGELGYPFYMHYTLNPYGEPVEPHLPPVAQRVSAFEQLSRAVGAQRVVWRYDPILLQGDYTVAYHKQAFTALAQRLSGFTEQCVISFLDVYGGRMPGAAGLADRCLTAVQMQEVAATLAPVAKRYGIALSTCAEAVDLRALGISHAACIDRGRIEELLGCAVQVKKDAAQRGTCRCVESVDIGSYNSCGHGCVYCYATSHMQASKRNMQRHDPSSPQLLGWPSPTDKLHERIQTSIKTEQTSWF